MLRVIQHAQRETNLKLWMKLYAVYLACLTAVDDSTSNPSQHLPQSCTYSIAFVYSRCVKAEINSKPKNIDIKYKP